MKNKETRDDFTLRIANASPLQLVIINYEMLLLNIDEAVASEEDEEFYKYIEKAKGHVRELMIALDLTQEISEQLLSIYFYINELLIKAGVKVDKEERNAALHEAHELLSSLLEAWVELEKTGAEGDIEDSATKVFAGLTYNSNGEMEEYIDNKRGYDV